MICSMKLSLSSRAFNLSSSTMIMLALSVAFVIVVFMCGCYSLSFMAFLLIGLIMGASSCKSTLEKLLRLGALLSLLMVCEPTLSY